jgi:superfamily I DNA/RNA helicase
MTEFNEIQKQIITTDKPHVLVCSAAASGKTQTLIGRLKYLLDSGVDPSEIVAITFTNNAASVMYERLGYPNGLFIGTVHSYCNYLLRGGAIDTRDILDQERFDDLFPRIEENKSCIKHISHLILDEGQDSTEAQFKFFELLNPDN